MRRFLSLLLAVLVLLLSCLPCNDGAAVPAGTAAAAAHKAAGSSPEKDRCTDDCSPFCGCVCGMAVILPALAAALPPGPLPEPPAPVLGAYRSGVPAAVYRSIWQPPQNS